MSFEITNILLVVLFVNTVKSSVLKPNGHYYYTKINIEWDKPTNENEPEVIVKIMNVDQSKPKLPGDDMKYETDIQNHNKKQPMDIETYFSQFKNSISKKKCLQYVNKLKDEERKNTKEYADRIVGGRYSKEGEFPHMGALGYCKNNKLSFKCGSSLISEEFLITAKHCVMAEKPVIVRLGVENLNNHTRRKARDVEIKNIISHDEKDVDIALIQLKVKVRFDRFVRPACILKSGEKTKSALITGWGQTDTSPTNHATSTTLKMAEVDLIPKEKCRKDYELKKDGEKLVEGKICAHKRDYKTNTTVADTCGGDSGGPLQVKMNTATSSPVYNIMGITAGGSSTCAMRAPAVYTNITQVLPWIEKNVWRDKVREGSRRRKCQKCARNKNLRRHSRQCRKNYQNKLIRPTVRRIKLKYRHYYSTNN